MGLKKITKEEFINRVNSTFGDRYDCTGVEFINMRTPIFLFDKEKQDYIRVIPNNLFRKFKSSERSGRVKKLTKKEFIERAKKIHGNKYDYSKVKYIDYETPVTIICPIHGEFQQSPNSHLHSYGCPKCGHKNINADRKLTTEEFIKKAKEVHGDKYDYSKVEYKNNKTPVTIICPIHGEFKQRPANHLSGNGCKKCAVEESRLSKEIFITRSRLIHGYKYDYSKVRYVDSATKICIICPKHGEFWQIPTDHLDGHGCPFCNERKLEKETREFLTKQNINFEFQKHFDWLGRQSLDFYLPDYNIAIEYQGSQHFESNEFFGGEKSFNEQVERDKRKKSLCEQHNLSLIYINFDENVDARLRGIYGLQFVFYHLINYLL